MIEYTNLLNMQLVIFVLAAIGYFLGKFNIISSNCRKGLTDLVINIVLPCNIIYSFLIKINSEIIKSSFLILVISFGIQIGCYLLSFLFFKKYTHPQQMVLKYATICSNAGFLGNPLIEGIYGSNGLLFASIYLIPQRIFMWSAGISCFTCYNKKTVIKKLFTHPCIISVIIGFIIMIFQIKLPTFTLNTISSLSGCLTALSMIIIGGILSEISINSVITKSTVFYSIIRLILIPGIVLAVCIIFKIPYIVTAVSTILSGMPAGTTTAILAAKYKGDEKFAVKCIFLSTVLSLLSIPLLCMIVDMIVK